MSQYERDIAEALQNLMNARDALDGWEDLEDIKSDIDILYVKLRKHEGVE